MSGDATDAPADVPAHQDTDHRSEITMSSYPRGQRVALVHTDDPYTELQPGDTGTVVRHDQALQTVHVAWDSGSSLAMCLDCGDQITPLAPAPQSAGDHTA
jgi:hypothetical protein